jgi:hypothetical protein
MNTPSNWQKPLLAMIETSLSREAMEHVRDYVPDDAAWAILKEASLEVLDACRSAGRACVPMSALFAEYLSDRAGIPVPVVAGALKLDGAYMFGGNGGIDGARVFTEGDPDWDGHCWVLFGRHIVDISLGRTARRNECRPALANRIVEAFGPNVGLIALTPADARDVRLQYLPRYVLTPDQVIGSARGAMQQFVQ